MASAPFTLPHPQASSLHTFPSPRAWDRTVNNTRLLQPGFGPAADLMAATRMPELLSPLRTLELVQRFRAQNGLDFSLPCMLRSKLGYFLLRSALECTQGGTALLGFVEDVVAFHMCASPYARHQMYASGRRMHGEGTACACTCISSSRGVGGGGMHGCLPQADHASCRVWAGS
jgi:hypothetical protein